jgi:hypothetical protein
MTRSLCGASALAIAAMLATAPHAATLKATDSNSTWTQVGAAAALDTVELSCPNAATSCNYGQLPLWNFAKSGMVTIKPAAGVAITISELDLQGSANLFVSGLTVKMGTATQYGIDIEGAHDITVDSMTVQGPDCTTMGGVGAWLRNLPTNSKVVVQHIKFSCLGAGLGALDSDGLSVLYNDYRHIQTDGNILTGVTNVVVKGNTGGDFNTAGGGHPDFIQFASTATTATSNVTIADNTFIRGLGRPVAGRLH